MKHRFLQEARAASALNHPNIVVLHDISSHDGHEFLVMEHVAGKALNNLIAPGGMPLDDVTKLGAQIAVRAGSSPCRRHRPPRHQARKYHRHGRPEL